MDKQDTKKKAKSATYRSARPAPTKEGREVLQVLTEDLPVQLLNREKRELGLQLAGQTEELEKHRAHKKEVTSHLKSRETAIEAQIKTISLSLRSGTKLMPVNVHAEADFDEGIVRYVRADTKEEIRTRPLASDERQGRIPGTEEPHVADAPLSVLPPGVTRADEEEPPEAA